MMATMRAREREDVEIVGDLGAELLQLIADLVAAERGQALQAKIEDGAGLLLGEPVGAARPRPCGADRRSARPAATMSLAGQSRAINCSRAAAGSGASRMSSMTSSILATAMAKPDKDMRAIARLAQQELGAAADHLLAESR